MKKNLLKIMGATLMSMLILSATGCGSKEATVNPNDVSENSSVEETVSDNEIKTDDVDITVSENETVSDNEVEIEEEKVEEVENTIEINTTFIAEDPACEEGLEKMKRVVMAYNEILNCGEFVAHTTLYDIENFDNTIRSNNILAAANGDLVNTMPASWSIICAYYDNYVNNNGTIYNFGEWVEEQPSLEAIENLYFKDFVENPEDGYDYTYCEDVFSIASFGATLNNFKEIKGTLFEDITKYNAVNKNGEHLKYSISFLCDNKYEGNAVFDENMNLRGLFFTTKGTELTWTDFTKLECTH